MSVVESQHASHDGHRPSDPAAGAAGRAGAGPSPRGSAERRRAPLALAATVTTVWAGLVSLAPTIAVVFVVYAADSADASIAPVARLVLAGWLLAHGVPVHTELGPIGLAPLAITAFAAWRVMRAGVHTARALKARRSRSPWRTLAAGVGVGFVYGLLGAATAAAAKLPSMSVSVPRAWITLTVFGIVTGVVGAAVESGLLDRAAQAAPGLVRDAVRTGAVAALLVFGAGAAAAGMAVALAGGEASQVLADYGTGVVGQAGLTLLCLLYSPTLAVWAASYLIGPGFVLGADTTVTAAKVTLGPLPAAPALAGLPSAATPALGSVLLGLPLAAGMAAGWLLVRRSGRTAGKRGAPLPSWPAMLGATVLAGPVAGLGLTLASLAASGPLGSGRMAAIGPKVLPVSLTSAVILALGATIAAVATRLIVARRSAG